jgi:hypothetical protein
VAVVLRHPSVALVIVALLLTSPAVFGPPAPSESANFNLVWAIQFRDSFRAGVPWPRWLEGSFDGLGSPAFYFYGPLPFILIGPLDVLTLGRLDVERLLALTALLLLFLSGEGMLRWLRALSVGEGTAMLGAMAYMAAPYHQYDFHVRGALGEFAAFAALPYVALGVRAVARRAQGGATLLAVAWAALVCAHLPATVVAAVLVLPAILTAEACSLPHRRGIPGFLGVTLLAGLGGLALSAAYWLPALALLPHVAADQLWSGRFRAENWAVATPWRWPDAAGMIFMAPIIVAHGSIAAWLLIRHRAFGLSVTVRMFSAAAVFGTLAMSLPLPVLWGEGAPLASIQFPWRMLLGVEFLIVGALALAWHQAPPGRMLEGLRAYGLGLAVGYAVLLAQAGLLAMTARSPTWHAARAIQHERLPDALEYLPRGAPLTYGRAPSDAVGAILAVTGPLAARPFAWAEPSGDAQVDALPTDGAVVSLRIVADVPARIVLRRFHFPAWRLETADGEAGPALEAHGPFRLSSFRVPAGEALFRLVPASPLPARAGAAISLAALVLLLIVLVAPWRRRRRGGPTLSA